MTGKIVDFGKQNPEKGIKRLEQHGVKSKVEVLDSKTTPQPTQVDLRVHEETVTEDQENVRRRAKQDGTPDLRFRQAATAAQFDRVKRLEDE